jgi:hypothetical protein
MQNETTEINRFVYVEETTGGLLLNTGRMMGIDNFGHRGRSRYGIEVSGFINQEDGIISIRNHLYDIEDRKKYFEEICEYNNISIEHYFDKTVELKCLLCMGEKEEKYIKLDCSTSKSYHCLCVECFCDLYNKKPQYLMELNCCYCKRKTYIKNSKILYSSRKEFKRIVRLKSKSKKPDDINITKFRYEYIPKIYYVKYRTTRRTKEKKKYQCSICKSKKKMGIHIGKKWHR